MDKHTPGPWHIIKHATPAYSPQFGIYAEGQQNDLAHVINDNAAANAKLIAAAPELMAACEAAMAFAEGHPDRTVGWHDLRLQLCVMLRSAIARAEGK